MWLPDGLLPHAHVRAKVLPVLMLRVRGQDEHGRRREYYMADPTVRSGVETIVSNCDFRKISAIDNFLISGL